MRGPLGVQGSGGSRGSLLAPHSAKQVPPPAAATRNPAPMRLLSLSRSSLGTSEAKERPALPSMRGSPKVFEAADCQEGCGRGLTYEWSLFRHRQLAVVEVVCQSSQQGMREHTLCPCSVA